MRTEAGAGLALQTNRSMQTLTVHQQQQQQQQQVAWLAISQGNADILRKLHEYESSVAQQWVSGASAFNFGTSRLRVKATCPRTIRQLHHGLQIRGRVEPKKKKKGKEKKRGNLYLSTSAFIDSRKKKQTLCVNLHLWLRRFPLYMVIMYGSSFALGQRSAFGYRPDSDGAGERAERGPGSSCDTLWLDIN